MEVKQFTVNLECVDVDPMVAFYRDAFGFEICMSGGDEDGRWVVMRRDDIQIGFCETEELDDYRNRQEAGHYSMTLYFEVPDLDEWVAHLRMDPEWRIGDRPVEEPWGMRELAVVDPEGYQLTVAERITE